LFSDHITGFNGGGGFFGNVAPQYSESLLTIASTAIEKTDQAECNAGFLREQALLHIILISDESDQSTEHWATYVQQITAKKGETSLVKISSIAGDVPNGCQSNDITASAGNGYWNASSITNGDFMSICSFGENNDNLRTLAESSTGYRLDHWPIENTLHVSINEMALSDWNFSAISNLIIFDESVFPIDGDSVLVEYQYCP